MHGLVIAYFDIQTLLNLNANSVVLHINISDVTGNSYLTSLEKESQPPLNTFLKLKQPATESRSPCPFSVFRESFKDIF